MGISSSKPRKSKKTNQSGYGVLESSRTDRSKVLSGDWIGAFLDSHPPSSTSLSSGSLADSQRNSWSDAGSDDTSSGDEVDEVDGIPDLPEDPPRSLRDRPGLTRRDSSTLYLPATGSRAPTVVTSVMKTPVPTPPSSPDLDILSEMDDIYVTGTLRKGRKQRHSRRTAQKSAVRSESIRPNRVSRRPNASFSTFKAALQAPTPRPAPQHVFVGRARGPPASSALARSFKPPTEYRTRR